MGWDGKTKGFIEQGCVRCMRRRRRRRRRRIYSYSMIL
jgi:hypothetical protein